MLKKINRKECKQKILKKVIKSQGNRAREEERKREGQKNNQITSLCQIQMRMMIPAPALW